MKYKILEINCNAWSEQYLAIVKLVLRLKKNAYSLNSPFRSLAINLSCIHNVKESNTVFKNECYERTLYKRSPFHVWSKLWDGLSTKSSYSQIHGLLWFLRLFEKNNRTYIFIVLFFFLIF